MTHVNAFKQDVKDALTEAHEALSEAEEKFDSLLAKLEADEAPEAPVAPESTSEPQEPPKAPTTALNVTEDPKPEPKKK